MTGKTQSKDTVRELLDAIPAPTTEQLASLDERGDPKVWGVTEALLRINREKGKSGTRN